MVLDPNHLALLKDPINARDKSLYIPEGMSPDPKSYLKNLETLSSNAKNLKKNYTYRDKLSQRSISNPS